MLLALMLWVGAAIAGPAERLTTAANPDLPQHERQDAFNQLVMDYEQIRPDLENVLFDQDADTRERWIAARVMGHTRSPHAKTALLKLCDDPQPAMRAAAASGLGELGYKDTADRVGELLTDAAIMVRAEAAAALGKIGNESSARYLEAALRDGTNYYRDESLWVRSHYVQALGQIRSQTSIPVLITCLDDPDQNVQNASLEALRQIVGYDFAEGRSRQEHMEAWRRWHANQ
jgi:HEAT repeat protein